MKARAEGADSVQQFWLFGANPMNTSSLRRFRARLAKGDFWLVKQPTETNYALVIR